MTDVDLTRILNDPNAVYLNLLRGTLARPTPEQIVSLYGAEAIRAALPSPEDPDTRIAVLRAELADQTAILEERFSDVRLAGFEDGVFTISSPIVPLMAEAMAQMLRPRPGSEPANYTETAITHHELGRLTLTLQRETGKTPHELRQAAETRADQAERRERALLDSNQQERSWLLLLASLRDQIRAAGRRAEAEPDLAPELIASLVRASR